MDQQVVKKRDVKLQPGKMEEAEYVQQQWIVNAEPGHTLRDVMEPTYWFHVARDIKPYAHIEVRDGEGKWIAFLIVINSGTNWASCVLDRQIDLAATAEEPPEAQLFSVKWRGPQAKFGVLRNADGKVLQDGFPDKASAYAWGAMNDHMMTA